METEDVSILHTVSPTYSYSAQPEYPFAISFNQTTTPVQLTAPDGSPVSSNMESITYSERTLDDPNLYLNTSFTDAPTSVVAGDQTQIPNNSAYTDVYGDKLNNTYQYYEYQTINTIAAPAPATAPAAGTPTAVTAQDNAAAYDITADYNTSTEAGQSTTQAVIHFLNQHIAALNQDSSVLDSDPEVQQMGNELAGIVNSAHHINLRQFWAAAAETVSGGVVLAGAETIATAVAAPAGVVPLLAAGLVTDGVLKVTDAVLGSHYDQAFRNHLSAFFHGRF